MSLRKTLINSKFVEALFETGFNVDAAAEKAGITVRTVRRWYKDKELWGLIESYFPALEARLLGAALKKVDKGDTTMIIFLLKSINRFRWDEGVAKQALMNEGMKDAAQVATQIQFYTEGDEEELAFTLEEIPPSPDEGGTAH